MKIAVIIERSAEGCSAYSPDVPGCVAAARTLGQTRRLMKSAIEGHLAAMANHGYALPKPRSRGENIDVNVSHRKAS